MWIFISEFCWFLYLHILVYIYILFCEYTLSTIKYKQNIKKMIFLKCIISNNFSSWSTDCLEPSFWCIPSTLETTWKEWGEKIIALEVGKGHREANETSVSYGWLHPFKRVYKVCSSTGKCSRTLCQIQSCLLNPSSPAASPLQGPCAQF